MILIIPEPRAVNPSIEFEQDLGCTLPPKRRTYVRLMNLPEFMARHVIDASAKAFLRENPGERETARLMAEHCWGMRREMAILN